MKAILLAALIVLVASAPAQANDFIHPGLLHTRADLERMRSLIEEKTEPARSSFLSLRASADAGYAMAGPWETIARDGEHARTKAGNERDFAQAYRCALLWCLTDSQQYALKAMEIIRAYSRTLRRIEGHDAPLMAGLNGFILVNACELMRHTFGGWTAEDTEQTEKMLRQVFLPVLDEFEENSPYANGNWGVADNKMRLAAGIFLDDSLQVSHALEAYLNAYDNSALPRYIAPSGQCQESGRDQAHTMLGLTSLAETCETAWSQGIDLYGELDNRLLAGFEYTAKANLGYDVPFETWQDVTGLYSNWTSLGAKALGQWRPGFEIPYNHYVGRKGLEMPYTSAVLHDFVRPEGQGVGNDEVGFGSLLFYQGTSVSPLPKKAAKRKGNAYVPTLLTYEAPQGAPLMSDYRVEARVDGGEWHEVPTYMAQANAGDAEGNHSLSEYSYTYFDFAGTVNVRVTRHGQGRKYSYADVRPHSRGVLCNCVNDSVVELTLWQPECISLEFDGDIRHNLLIFASLPGPAFEDVRSKAEAEGGQVIRFGPGYHKLRDTLRLASHQCLYLEGGAYLDGKVLISDAESVQVCGWGVIRPTGGREGLEVTRSRNVRIEGVITTQCPVGESSGVSISDVRCLSHYPWGDGLNVFASQDISYDRVFCRTSDDCTTVYATRLGHRGSSRSIRMKNSILWPDVAHAIFIGLHGDCAAGDSCTDIRYEGIDILGQNETQLNYQGAIAINAGDDVMVRRVSFENIRLEDITRGSILQLRVWLNPKYCSCPGRGIEDISFTRLFYNGKTPNPSLIMGYDQERMVRNISFKDLRINGRKIYDQMPGKPGYYLTTDMANIFVGENVENLTFEP